MENPDLRKDSKNPKSDSLNEFLGWRGEGPEEQGQRPRQESLKLIEMAEEKIPNFFRNMSDSDSSSSSKESGAFKSKSTEKKEPEQL